MKPDIIDFASFVLLTVVFLAACFFAKRSKVKRRKLPPVGVLLSLIEQRPLPCKLCPIRGFARRCANTEEGC